MEKIKGKKMEKSDRPVAIVIGASGNVGKTAALRFATEGRAVAVHYYRNKEKAEEIVKQIRHSGGIAIAVGADFTQFAQAEALARQTVESFGRIDILAVCSGGHAIPDELKTLPRLERYRIWNRLIEHNLSGDAFCAYAVIPQMVKQNYGRIIFLSSGAKDGMQQSTGYVDILHRCAYAASKEGIVGLTHTLANYLARYNITVNCVVPGMILDPSSPTLSLQQKKALMVPMKRRGTPEEMVAAIVFLASEKASYITGNTLYAHGGLMLGGFNPELVNWVARAETPLSTHVEGVLEGVVEGF